MRVFRYEYHLIKRAEVGVEVHAIESENIKGHLIIWKILNCVFDLLSLDVE